MFPANLWGTRMSLHCGERKGGWVGGWVGGGHLGIYQQRIISTKETKDICYVKIKVYKKEEKKKEEEEEEASNRFFKKQKSL